MVVQFRHTALVLGLVLCAVLMPLRLAAQTDSGAPLTTTTLVAIQDTWINSGSSNNWGTQDSMNVGASNFLGVERSLVQFDMSSIPASAVIEGATLRLFYNLCNVNCPAMDSSVHRLTQSWSEATANWPSMGNASAPMVYATYSFPAGYGGVNNWVEWNVTDLVREWHSGGVPNYGLAVHGPEGPPETYKYFRTKEFGAGWAPQLVIVWDYPTPTPTNTPTSTITPTITPTPTATATPTATPTPTITPTPTATPIMRTSPYLPLILVSQ